ncbi:MAG: DUF4373 domain-containing protein [Sphaerochaeta sp.]|jgi:hypothetical protein|nr:DUF4373 domain-containing protein [Sphaerochaeta sp.]
MARPIKEGMDYFPHDTDASTDEKIEALEALYGNDGYAVYFKLCERIYRTPDGELDVSDPDTYRIYARRMHLSLKKFEEILEKAVKIGLFDQLLFQKTKRLSSNGIKKRRGSVIDKRIYMRDRRQETKLNDGISEELTTQQTTPQSTQSKVKESKVKETKETLTPLPPVHNSPLSVSVSVSLSDINDVKTICQLNLIDNLPEDEVIKGTINEYSKPWIVEAVKESCKANNLSWDYVLGILHNCKAEGHAPGEARSSPGTSCAGCNHLRSRSGQPLSCAVGYYPPSKCEDYQPPRAQRPRS